MENTEGKCISCGLLMKRTGPDHSGLSYYEVRPGERRHGHLFTFPGVRNPAVHCVPGCYAGVAPLAQEIMGEVPGRDADEWISKQNQWQQNALEALSKDRQCPSWVKYVVGLPPEWHLERYEMDVLQKAREEWELRLEQDRRDWQKEFQNQTSKFGDRLTVAAVILGGLQVVAAIISLTPDSWFVKLIFSWLYSPIHK